MFDGDDGHGNTDRGPEYDDMGEDVPSLATIRKTLKLAKALENSLRIAPAERPNHPKEK